MRSQRSVLLAAVLLTGLAGVLTGCAAGADTQAPEPTSEVASTSSAEPSGVATPAAVPSGAPDATATPTATARAAAPSYCGDDYVLEATSTGPTAWVGTREEVLEALEPAATFEPAGAIEGLDVHCVATYRIAIDGADGIATVAEAVLAPAGALDHLAAWASANDYEPLPGTDGFVEHHAPANPDGTTTMKIKWSPLEDEETMAATADRVFATTDAPAGAVFVWHIDFTQP